MEHRLGAICSHGQLARQCELCDRDREIAHLRAELQRKSDAIQRLWRERDQLRAAAEEARRVLSMPLLMEGDAPVEKALRMLDEALGMNSDNTKVT